MLISRLRLPTVLIMCALASNAWANPRADYLLHCGGCHLADGRGAPPEVPTLVAVLGPIVASQEGRDYIVRVPGASQAPLTDAELAQVMNWVLVTFNAETLDPNFNPLTGNEVGKARRQVLADPIRLRRALWPGYE